MTMQIGVRNETHRQSENQLYIWFGICLCVGGASDK